MDNILTILDTLITWLSLPEMRPMDFVEIALIAVVFYYVIKWIKTTRAWVIVKGLIVLLLVWIAATLLKFDVILWLFTNTIGVGITAVLILFQPELRRVLETLGERKILPFDMFTENKEKSERFSNDTLEALIEGTFAMARVKTGALIVIEQDLSVQEHLQYAGRMVDAIVSSELLINIFEKNTPLHDGAVIIRGDRVVCAKSVLPLSSNMQMNKDFGTRHRAGVGISEVTDCLAIIVSEETGRVALAQKGRPMENIDGDFLRAKLLRAQKGKEQETKKKKRFPRVKGKRENEGKTQKNNSED